MHVDDGGLKLYKLYDSLNTNQYIKADISYSYLLRSFATKKQLLKEHLKTNVLKVKTHFKII